MAERQSEDEADAAGGKARRAGAPLIGRRIATGLFWVCALYLAGVGFYSIPMQIWNPDTAAAAPSAQCGEGLSELRAELLSRAGERITAGGGNDPSELDAWFHDWDRRHAAMATPCASSGEELHAQLDRMRQGIEMSLRRFDREQAPVNREIDRGLRNLSARE